MVCLFVGQVLTDISSSRHIFGVINMPQSLPIKNKNLEVTESVV